MTELFEIGGYLEFEKGRNATYHNRGFLYNSARNALVAFLIHHGIKRVFLPHYLCGVVAKSIKKMTQTEIEYYHVNGSLLPDSEQECSQDEIFYYVNYFGLRARQFNEIAIRLPCIIDNSQAFFAKPLIKDAHYLYSPRKFFGVPDGGILVTAGNVPVPAEKYQVWDKMEHLVRRIDQSAEAAYTAFKRNEELLGEVPVLAMSEVTERILGSLDYQTIAARRKRNFGHLHANLSHRNELAPLINRADDDFVPHTYPLLWDGDPAELRRRLIRNKIYIPVFWPELIDDPALTVFERNCVTGILPLPVDQRYSIGHMDRILEIIHG
jgi:hypothetical protein